MDWQALALTLKLAALTTAILLCIAVPLAAWLALGRSRWRVLAEAITGLPLVLPPTVLGFYLLVLLGPRTAEVAVLREGKLTALGPAVQVLAAERKRLQTRLG